MSRRFVRAGVRALGAGVALFLATLAPAQEVPKDFEDAFVEQRKAAEARMREGDYAAAETIARQRLAVAREKLGAEHAYTAGALALLAVTLRAQGRFGEAERLHQDSLAIFVKSVGPDHPWTLDQRLRLANVYMDQTRLVDALRTAEEALAQAERIKSDRGRLRLVLATLGRVHTQLGSYAQAQRFLDRALQVARAMAGGKPDLVVAETLVRLAQLERNRERLQAAEPRAREAATIYEALAADRYAHAWALEAHGGILVQLGRSDEAVALLERAAKSNARILPPVHEQAVRTAGTLGLAYEGVGRIADAERELRRAAKDIDASGVPGEVVFVNARAGRFFVRQKRLADALPHWRRALEVVDELYASTRGFDEARRHAFAQRFGYVTHESLQTLLELYRAGGQEAAGREVVEVMSRSQSRLFTEMLRLADVTTFSAEPRFASLRAEREELRARVERLQRAIAGGEPDGDVAVPAAARLARLASEAVDAAGRLAKVDAALWGEFPRYMEIASPRPVRVQELQARVLLPGEVLVSYALQRDHVLIAAMTRERYLLRTAPIGAAELARRVRAVREPIERATRLGSVSPLGTLDPADLHALQQALLAPVRELLEGAQTVLVVADGALLTLPFEMLVEKWGAAEAAAFRNAAAPGAPQFAGYAGLEWTGMRYRFAYYPSLGALVSQRQNPKPARPRDREFLSFAHPDFAGRAGLADLPETADEARAIAKLLGQGTEVHVRGEANEARVKRTPLAGTRYLHFATHGLLEADVAATAGAGAPRFPRQPGLVLSLRGDLQGEDGFLTMREVMENLDLDADIVALSACNTAGETEAAQRGEGFAGLTRAFMYAGARRLVVSHWQVDSASARDLMVGFFRRIRAGEPPAVALQAAQREIAADRGTGRPYARAHPFFWAPFVLVGG